MYKRYSLIQAPKSDSIFSYFVLKKSGSLFKIQHFKLKMKKNRVSSLHIFISIACVLNVRV